jgi:Cu2+-containing amine oxidase
LTKTCQGKVVKEKLKSVKTKDYFLLPNSYFRHRLGFAAQNLRVDRAKDHVSSPQT